MQMINYPVVNQCNIVGKLYLASLSALGWPNGWAVGLNAGLLCRFPLSPATPVTRPAHSHPSLVKNIYIQATFAGEPLESRRPTHGNGAKILSTLNRTSFLSLSLLLSFFSFFSPQQLPLFQRDGGGSSGNYCVYLPSPLPPSPSAIMHFPRVTRRFCANVIT